jgi:hypothetical protein
MDIKLNNPIQEFIFFIVSEISEEDVRKVEKLVKEVSLSRKWVIDPPQFVNEIDEPENPEIDEPIRTLGGMLQVYSALPPNQLPHEIDKKHYEEVKTIINSLIDFSKETSCEIECELDGVNVGTIDDGQADNLITEGLLGEWEAGLKRYASD